MWVKYREIRNILWWHGLNSFAFYTKLAVFCWQTTYRYNIGIVTWQSKVNTQFICFLGQLPERGACWTNWMTQSSSKRTHALNQNRRTLGRFDCCHLQLGTIQIYWTQLLCSPDNFFSAESRSVFQKTALDRNSCTERSWAHRFHCRFLHWDTDCSCSSHWYKWRHQCTGKGYYESAKTKQNKTEQNKTKQNRYWEW